MTDQSQFIESLLEPASPVPEGLLDAEGRKAGKRFDVYRNNVAVSLTEALETAFPVCRKLVGDAFFKAMAGVFLRQHPPSSPLMMHYGSELPGFLEQFPPAQSLPYLPDVARLEQELRHSYHAHDRATMKPEDLSALEGDALVTCRFELVSAVRFVSSSYPVYGIWKANTDPTAPKPEPAAETAMISRPELDPVVDRISAAQHQFFLKLQSGAVFGDALDHATGIDPEFDLTSTLGLAFSRSMFATLEE